MLASEILTGEDQVIPPSAELRYQTFQASELRRLVSRYQARTSPLPTDSTAGLVAFSFHLDSRLSGIHVSPPSEDR